MSENVTTVLSLVGCSPGIANNSPTYINFVSANELIEEANISRIEVTLRNNFVVRKLDRKDGNNLLNITDRQHLYY